MKKVLATAGVLIGLVAQQAHAAADAAFTGAVTTVSADIATYGGSLVTVAAVGVGFMIAIKYVKKIRGAA